MTDTQALSVSPAVEFLTAFNQIEQYLRQQLNARNSDSFKAMVSWAERDHLINSSQHTALDAFSDLRNAISHGNYRDGRAIADPRPDVIAEIQHLRDLLLDPPTALAVLGHHEVRTVAPGDDVRDMLAVIRKTAISQLPIYDEGRCIGMVTTKTIARWVAADLGDNDRLDAVTVADVLKWAEDEDRALFLPRGVGAQEAIDALTTPTKKGAMPRAAIITEHGRKDQRPIRIIGGRDIAVLMEAVR